MTNVQTNRMEVAEKRMMRTCGKAMLDVLPTGFFRMKLRMVWTC